MTGEKALEDKRCLVLIDQGALKVELEGNWNRYELDQAYKAMLRQLPIHKRVLAEEYKKAIKGE